MKTAILIKDNLTTFNGHASLYFLSESILYDTIESVNYYTNYVICSSVNYPLLSLDARIFETLIFPADKYCNILNSNELYGSTKNTENHEEVLLKAGYILIEKPFNLSIMKLKLK